MAQTAGESRRTRVGLIGVNERARRLLLAGLAESPRARIAAVCSRDAAKAAATAVRHGARPFTNVREMMRSGEIDAAYVNTPVEAHFELCMAAIEAGCAVICEKPLAQHTAEAAALDRAAASRSLPAAVNFTYRSMAGYRLTERLLAEGGIGRPLHAEFALLQGHNFLPGFPRSSAWLDSGVHLFDVIHGLSQAAGFGRLDGVCAAPMLQPRSASDATRAHATLSPGDRRPSGSGPDRIDFGWGFTARTDSGAVISAVYSRMALGWRNGLRWSLYGEDGAIWVELDAERTDVRVVHRGDSRPQGSWRSVAVPPDILAGEARFPSFHMDRLVQAIRGEAPFPGFAEAVATHRLADALAESAATGRWTRVVETEAGPVPASGHHMHEGEADGRCL
ncbi:MAG: Gfo/Idh/MocA family oxidoreductase [Chloroflexi bacterium]|nr:Gfo/Idh/MocA family oxidoreductase [Chloroflexota bacterium]